jgi:DNA topoisomerase VI subunit B
MRKALVDPTRPMTEPSLVRLVFKTSRLAEFCSQKELVNQTGHSVEAWPLVILKELVDNALDAAEEAEIAPAIRGAFTNLGAGDMSGAPQDDL